ncbi:MAG: hypothetical protein AAGF28_06310 [Pseudomonadota bacterium]
MTFYRFVFGFSFLLFLFGHAPGAMAQFTSGAATPDATLALRAFILNATASAKSAKLLGPDKHSPARVAANQLRAAARTVRMKQLGKVFGKEALNAASTLLGLKGAQKTKAVVDLLNTWANSTSKTDFVKTFLRDKAAGKLGDKIKKLTNKEAERLAQSLYDKMTAQARSLGTQNIPAGVTGTFDCKPGAGKMNAVVRFVPGDINIRIAGDCNCEMPGQRVATYFAVIVGATHATANSKGETLIRFVGHGMQFGGTYCPNQETGVRRSQKTYASGVLRKNLVTKTPQIKFKEICTLKDCAAIIDRMEANISRVASLNTQLRYLLRVSQNPQGQEALADGINQARAQNEALCRYFNDCDCDKISTAKFMDAKARSGRTRKQIYLEARRNAGNRCR